MNTVNTIISNPVAPQETVKVKIDDTTLEVLKPFKEIAESDKTVTYFYEGPVYKLMKYHFFYTQEELLELATDGESLEDVDAGSAFFLNLCTGQVETFTIWVDGVDLDDETVRYFLWIGEDDLEPTYAEDVFIKYDPALVLSEAEIETYRHKSIAFNILPNETYYVNDGCMDAWSDLPNTNIHICAYSYAQYHAVRNDVYGYLNVYVYVYGEGEPKEHTYLAVKKDALLDSHYIEIEHVGQVYKLNILDYFSIVF